MYLEIPKKLQALVDQAHLVGEEVFRPISRKYDLAEHEYPKELDMLAAVMDGMSEGDANMSAGAGKLKQETRSAKPGVRNGTNMSTVLGLIELCWGDVGLALTHPAPGPRQRGDRGGRQRRAARSASRASGRRWRSPSPTRAATRPRSAPPRARTATTTCSTARRSSSPPATRCDCVVVWATLDPNLGRAAIKSFVVEKGTPGMEVARLEHKLGIKASDTATILFTDCRVPEENLLGSPEVDVKQGFGGVMQTFDNTRPVVAAMGVGVARAALEKARELLKAQGYRAEYDRNLWSTSSVEAELYRMEADLEAARLLTIKAAWMADNGQPNSMEASMAKAKAGRTANAVTLRCAELCGALGYERDASCSRSGRATRRSWTSSRAPSRSSS